MTSPAGYVELSKGDPVYSIWIWRQDSITLARLRGPLMNLMELANHRCEHLLHAPLLCAETGEHKQHWCWPCKIKQLVMDIQLATASHSVPTEATNEGKPDA